MSPENAIYTVLLSAVEAANDEVEDGDAGEIIIIGEIKEPPIAETENPLKNADVHPTVYSPIREIKTIRVGNCESTFSPDFDNTIKEFDADIVLQILAKVEDKEDSALYAPARDTAREMTIEVIRLLLADSSLSRQVCDLKIQRAFRGWTQVESAVYAVSLLPVQINPINYD